MSLYVLVTEGGEREDLGDDLVLEDFLVGELLHVSMSLLLLLLVVVEDDRAVLGAYIASLPVEGGGVVRCKEDLQQNVKCNH